MLAPGLRQTLFALDRAAGASEKVKRALRVAKSFFSGLKVSIGGAEISVEAEPGVADMGDIESDLPAAIEALAEAARDRKSGVALVIDELQYLSEKELSALIMSMHQVAKTTAPVVLLGAGLPQLPALAGDSKSYAERLFDFRSLGPLSQSDTASALRSPIVAAGGTVTNEALAAIMDATKGYPYFIQEWGYHSWNAAPETGIDEAVVKAAGGLATRRLDEAFFRVRFDRLTHEEKRYMRALAELGPGEHASGAVAHQLGKTSAAMGPIRDRLIKKGMAYSPSYGRVAFTVPLFDEFMTRAMPAKPVVQLPDHSSKSKR